MKFRFICENADFVKIELPPRREHDFQGSERRKIDKKLKKIDVKKASVFRHGFFIDFAWIWDLQNYNFLN